MGTGQIGGPDNGPQIMGVLNTIQQKQKGRLSLFFRRFQHIFHLCVFIGGSIGHNALMMAGFRHGVQPLPGNKGNYRIPFFCLPDNRLYRAILAAIQHKQPVDGLSGAEGLQNRIPAFNGQFLISHSVSPCMISFVSFSRPEIPTRMSDNKRSVWPDR